MYLLFIPWQENNFLVVLLIFLLELANISGSLKKIKKPGQKKYKTLQSGLHELFSCPVDIFHYSEFRMFNWKVWSREVFYDGGVKLFFL